MLRYNRTNHQTHAQTLMEYTLVLGVVLLILVAMTPIIKRGSQGMIKFVADQVGNQQNSDQTFDDTGHLINSFTIINSLTGGRTEEFLSSDGAHTRYGYNDEINMSSTTFLNLGFTEKQN